MVSSDGVFETSLGSRDTIFKISSRSLTTSLDLDSRKIIVLKSEKSGDRAGFRPIRPNWAPHLKGPRASGSPFLYCEIQNW